MEGLGAQVLFNLGEKLTQASIAAIESRGDGRQTTAVQEAEGRLADVVDEQAAGAAVSGGKDGGCPVMQEFCRDQRDVYGEQKRPGLCGGAEGGFEASARAGVKAGFVDDRGEVAEVVAVAGDADGGAERAQLAKGELDQGCALEGEQGFVGAHAGAAAAG